MTMIKRLSTLKRLSALNDFTLHCMRLCLAAMCLLLFQTSSICQKKRQVVLDGHSGIGKYINCPGTLISQRAKISYGAKLQVRDQIASRFYVSYGVGWERVNGAFTCASAISIQNRTSSLWFLSVPVGIDYTLKDGLFVSIEPTPSFILKNGVRFAGSSSGQTMEVNDDSMKGFLLPLRLSTGIALSESFDVLLTGMFSVGDPDFWQICTGIRCYLKKGYRSGL